MKTLKDLIEEAKKEVDYIANGKNYIQGITASDFSNLIERKIVEACKQMAEEIMPSGGLVHKPLSNGLCISRKRLQQKIKQFLNTKK